jgi:hypothetical protein
MQLVFQGISSLSEFSIHPNHPGPEFDHMSIHVRTEKTTLPMLDSDICLLNLWR